MTNTNLETGIRYGIISAVELHQEIIDELQAVGTDVHYEDFKDEVYAAMRAALAGYVRVSAIDAAFDVAIEESEFYDDEPVHEGTHCGVKYRTTWLGGALHVWVFESPHTGLFTECSPCVPCAGNLDCPDPHGVLTYDVPPEWRWKDE